MTDFIGNAEILFDDDVFYRIKQILKSASPPEDVFVVTPYVKLDTRMKEAFDEACGKNVRVTMLIRADADHPLEDINWLLRKRVILKKVDKLHAKVYLGASSGLVTSMNLHSHSGLESKEVGVCFTDEQSLKRLEDKVEKWISDSREVDPVGAASRPETREKPSILIKPVGTTHSSPNAPVTPTHTSPANAKLKGYCIRCSKPKTLNPEYPLCDDCYKEWVKYKNPTYEEKICHRCGKANKTTVVKPLCRDCYKLDPFDKAIRNNKY